MNELSIKVTVAGRIYPLTIKREEEETVRKSAKLIEDKLKDFEQNYSIRDKQDLLAMCALQFANQVISFEGKEFIEGNDVYEKLNEIDTLVTDCLNVGK